MQELDYHGYTGDDAAQDLRNQIFGYRHMGVFNLKIITGIGSGVVKMSIIDVLNEEGISYYEENSGCIIVKLR